MKLKELADNDKGDLKLSKKNLSLQKEISEKNQEIKTIKLKMK